MSATPRSCSGCSTAPRSGTPGVPRHVPSAPPTSWRCSLSGFLEHRDLDLRTRCRRRRAGQRRSGRDRGSSARWRRAYPSHEPLVVGPGMKTGVSVLTDNPREVGADRVVNTLAAFTMFGGPAIVVDFGTGDELRCRLRGGGVPRRRDRAGSADQRGRLFGRTARLTRVDLQPPRSPIGTFHRRGDPVRADLRHGWRGRRDRRTDPRGPAAHPRRRCRDRRARARRAPALPHRGSVRAVAHARGASPRLREERR